MCRDTIAVGFSNVLGNLRFVCMINMLIFMFLLRIWCATIARPVKCLDSHGSIRSNRNWIFSLRPRPDKNVLGDGTVDW